MRTDNGRTVDGMNPISRRKLFQTGLAGVGVLGAVGISLGLAGATHSTPSAQSETHHARSHRSHETDDDSGFETKRQTPSSTPSVSSPTPSPPQATTSGA